MIIYYDPFNPKTPLGKNVKDKWGRPPGSRDYGKAPKKPKATLPGSQRPTNRPASSGGGGGYGGGGGGGGGTAAEGLSPYIQYYRMHYFANGKPPAALLQKAKDNNWSVGYFADRVRREDPNYLKSAEAKVYLTKFTRTMKALFPGLADKQRAAALMKSPFYRKAAVWYLRSGQGTPTGGGIEALYGYVTGTQRWNRANPYWKQYAANRSAAVQEEANPLVYKELQQTLRQSFADAGMQLPDDYYRAFFRSRYASSEGMKGLADNLSNLVQKGSSFAWMEGAPMNKAQTRQQLFGTGKGPTDLRSRLARSFTSRGSFLSNDVTGASSALNQRGQLVKPLL
jgi:hypothetical protein